MIETGTDALLKPLPFSTAEYARRHRALLAAMTEQGLDAFIAFGPENIYYLTGHDTPAYHYMQACLVTHDDAPINLVRAIDAGHTLFGTWSRRVVTYGDHEEPAETLASLVEQVCRHGWRVGLEADGFFVSPRRFRLIRTGLEALGIDVLEADLIAPLRLIKSVEELDQLRRAARLTEAAMHRAIATAAEGVSENEIAAEVWAELVRGGSEFPGLPPFIVSGARTSLGHATSAGRRLEKFDPLAFEIAGVVNRYASPLFRCGSVAPSSNELGGLVDCCQDALKALIAGIKPGISAEDLHGISAASFADRGYRVGHRSGYSVGIGYAPDWGEGHIFSIRAGEARRLEPGMVFHLVPGFFVPGRHGVVISETVAVTEYGCDCLTRFPRDLFLV